MSTEDFQTCRSVDSNPSTILPSSDMMEVVHLDDDRSSTSIADPKSQEIAPGNDTIIIEPDDSSNRFPLPETPQYPSPQCIPLTINLEQLFITEETAREALLSFGKTRPYYSSAAAEEMKFLDLLPSNTFRYSLETFAEFRVCQRKTEPYYNCEVDGPENGPPPHPWSIMVEPPVMFKEGNHRRKLPHTSSVKSCWKCNGSGKTNCDICYGTQWTTCPACMGAPHSQGRMCFACGGNGRRLCTGCCGRGYKVCNFCLGAKSILQYIEVTVYWTVFTTTALTNQETEIPSKKLTKVTGVPVFREEQVVVPPIMDFPDDSVNKTSQKIMQEHLSLSTSCRILGQKQILELLPVTKVKSTWKEKKCDFFVFGNECEVYTDTYPQTGRCTIM